MRRLLLSVLLVPAVATAQLAPADSVYDAVEVMPQIVGGPGALAAAVTYPEAAWRERVEGTVVVGFVVDAAGVLSEAAVLRTPSPLLADAALAALDSTRFVPGTIGGMPVAVRMALPVRFRLPEAPTEPPLSLAPVARAPIEEEVQPILLGGLEGLARRIVYPSQAREWGVEGTVTVQFVVTEDGLAEAPVVMRSVDPMLDAAALDAVRASHFRPGTQGGRPVRVRFSVPVSFRLR